MNASPMHDRKGLMLAIGAYVFWGVLPLYIHLLRSVPSLQLLAHRVVWSALLLIGIVLLLGRWGAMLKAARGRTLLYLLASTVMIAINWLVYIWAVQNDHLIEASLGYFINPLVNVALGMAVLGERLRRLQGVAIAIAAVGVAIMGASGGALWISLTLAVSFGLYGLIRKVAAIDALGGLTMETLLLAPLCLAWLVHEGAAGTGVWGESPWLDLMLVLAGLVTALPLLMFAAAARRMAYSTIGLLQYIAPTLQFLMAVLLFGEPLHTAHIVTFALIWTGCALYGWDMVRASRDAGAGI
ncbi:MAG: EamA family transporter RarD [Sphingomonas sp.]